MTIHTLQCKSCGHCWDDQAQLKGREMTASELEFYSSCPECASCHVEVV